jgi:hypothetical protein
MVEGHDLYGSMYQKAQEQRLEWDVFSEPRRLPREIRIVIKKHVERCLEDEGFAKAYATLDETPLTKIELTEQELMGEKFVDESKMARVLRPRLVMNRNLEPTAEINGSWSVLLEPTHVHPILKRLNDSLPRELFPEAGDTVEDILVRNGNCRWLDDIHRHKKRKSANGSADCGQPCRRSVSIAQSVNKCIEAPRDGNERPRRVSNLLAYRMPEQPLRTWMCRPATNEELGAVATIWEVSWPWLSRESRLRTQPMDVHGISTGFG